MAEPIDEIFARIDGAKASALESFEVVEQTEREQQATAEEEAGLLPPTVVAEPAE